MAEIAFQIMNATKTFLTIGLLALLLGGAGVTAAEGEMDAFSQNQHLGRGVNILGYDPIWRTQDQGRFKTEYFQKLKEAGFNSVRINLHAFRFMETNTWTLKPSWFKVLDWAVNEAQRQGLAVILDLHEFNAVGNNPAGNKEKLVAFWRQMAAHYQNAPATVVLRGAQRTVWQTHAGNVERILC